MDPARNEVETATLDVLAGRAGRKNPATVGELHMIVADLLMQRAAAQAGGTVGVTTGGLSDSDAARFAAVIEWLKKDGTLETTLRPGDLQDATFRISDRGRQVLQGTKAGIRSAAKASPARQDEGKAKSGSQIRQQVLDSILKHQGSGASYIADTEIAADLGLDLEEVQGHLHMLEERSRIKLASTSKGCSAFLSSSQQQRVREKQRRRSHAPSSATGVDPRSVFVVHGRNNAARNALFAFLRAIGLHPLEWTEIVRETGKGAPYIGEVLQAGFSIVQAVVVLLTPDDEARLREPYRTSGDPSFETTLTPQARPNVIFEAGMALGLFPDRTVIVELGQLRPMSDTVGRHVIRMDDSPGKRQELAQRLETAGCAVNQVGTDWLSSGDFGSATTA
jgi:predicted nucleotide-binding protein